MPRIQQASAKFNYSKSLRTETAFVVKEKETKRTFQGDS